MDKNDFFTGLTLIAVGVWVGWEATSFPKLAGMSYGPGLFPTIAASGLAICGLMIIAMAFFAKVKILTEPQEAADIEAPPNQAAAPALNTIAVLAVVVIYALTLDYLGFYLVSFPALLFLFLLLRVKWWHALLLAAVMTFLVHVIFYSFLHVPLPWGLLEPLAW